MVILIISILMVELIVILIISILIVEMIKIKKL